MRCVQNIDTYIDLLDISFKLFISSKMWRKTCQQNSWPFSLGLLVHVRSERRFRYILAGSSACNGLSKAKHAREYLFGYTIAWGPSARWLNALAVKVGARLALLVHVRSERRFRYTCL